MQIFIYCIELFYLFGRPKGRPGRGQAQLFNKWRGGQIGGMDAQVLHDETETDVVGHKAKQFVARRCGPERNGQYDDHE